MTHVLDLLPKRRGIISDIARACGITPGAVSQWHRVPAERVLDVERVTGVPRHALRPDLYPPPTLAPETADENDNPAAESLTPEECGA